MLSVLCKLLSADKNEKKTQYFSKVYKRETLNTSKGKIEETPLLCSREFLIDLLTLTQAGIKKKCGAQYANLDYRPENVYYDKDKDIICIGKQYQPGDVLTFDGETGEIISGEPLQILVGYTEGTTGKCLGYLVSEYIDGDFVTSRLTEQELLEKIVVDKVSCCNAMVTTTETGEQVLERKNQGFIYTIDTSDITQLKKVENIDKEALALTEKTVKIKRDTKLGQMMDTASNNILNWLAADEIGVCSDEQKTFLAEYYSWYTKRTFEFLQGSSDIKMRASKIMAMDSLHLSKDVQWKHIGYYTSPTRSFKCSDPSCGKALSKAHVFECNDPNVGHVKLMFGADCAEQFFDMTSDTLTCLADASTIVESEIKNIFNIFRNNRVEETWDEIGMFKDSIVSLRENNSLESTYGENNAKWLCGFLDNNIPFPDSLITTVVTGITRNTTEMKDDERAKRNERIHKEVNLVRAKALNTVSIGQTDEEFHAINFDFWTKKEPQYTELIKYLPESKEYFEFVLRYKMYGRPLTGEALDKFNAKHKTTLRRLKHFVGARKFNALELSQITELLKLELEISKGLGDISDLRKLVDDTVIADNLIEHIKSYFKDKDELNIKDGEYLYFLSLIRPYLPVPDVTDGKSNVKDSLKRRRLPVSSYKSRLLSPTRLYIYTRMLKNSVHYPNAYETDYDGDSLSKNGEALGKQLESLKEVKESLDEYVKNEFLPNFRNGILELNRELIEKAKREEEEKRLLKEKLEEVKKQRKVGFQPLEYNFDSLPVLNELYHLSGVRLSIALGYGNGEFYFATSGLKFVRILFDREHIRDEYYRRYVLYSDGVRIDLMDAKDSYSSIKETFLKEKTTYKCEELNRFEVIDFNNSNDDKVVSIVDKNNKKCLLAVIVNNYGEIRVKSSLVGTDKEYDYPNTVFEDFEEVYSTQKSSRLHLDKGFKNLSELEDHEKKTLSTLTWTKAHKEQDELLYLLYDADTNKIVYYGLTDAKNTYLRDIRGFTTDKESAISDLGVDYTEVKILNFDENIEDTLNEITQDSSKQDLVDILRSLLVKYPERVSSKSNLEMANIALDKKKPFDKLTSQYKGAVVQVICDIISYYKLDKTKYGLENVSTSLLNFTTYFDNDKDFENKIQKFMDALTVGDMELDSKSTSILKTVSRMRKCSDRQKKYIDDIEKVYEAAVYNKMID